jgi:hypothetical protein
MKETGKCYRLTRWKEAVERVSGVTLLKGEVRISCQKAGTLRV